MGEGMELTLAALAEASGVPARTIRFYIARGLVDGPAKGGRGAHYTGEHLARLEQIRTQQAEGRTLTEIARLLNPAGDDGQESPLDSAEIWWQAPLAGGDVVVSIRSGLAPWRMRQVRAALDEFARRIADSTPQGKETDDRDS